MSRADVKLIVLMRLGESASTGIELMNHFTRISQKKPSPGYIYPMLHDLESRKYIVAKTAGRRKIYSLTKEGKAFLRTMQRSHEAHLRCMERILSHDGADQAARVINTKERMVRRHLPKVMENAKHLEEFYASVLALYEHPQYAAKRVQLLRIIDDASAKVRRLAVQR